MEHKENPMQWGIINASKDMDFNVVDIEYDCDIAFLNKPTDVKNWWMVDLRDPYKLPDANVENIFLCNTKLMDAYAKRYNAKVHYLPQFGDERPIKKGRDINWNIVFIAGFLSPYHENRWPILKRLHLERRDFKLISGEGYTKDTPWIYNKTPISLAVSPQYAGYTSNRLYNILAAGGFCLTLYFKGIEDLFENKKHLVWFKDLDEMEELANYYLENKEERDEIAREGQKHYYNNHSAEHRIRFLLDKST